MTTLPDLVAEQTREIRDLDRRLRLLQNEITQVHPSNIIGTADRFLILDLAATANINHGQSVVMGVSSIVQNSGDWEVDMSTTPPVRWRNHEPGLFFSIFGFNLDTFDDMAHLPGGFAEVFFSVSYIDATAVTPGQLYGYDTGAALAETFYSRLASPFGGSYPGRARATSNTVLTPRPISWAGLAVGIWETYGDSTHPAGAAAHPTGNLVIGRMKSVD